MHVFLEEISSVVFVFTKTYRIVRLEIVSALSMLALSPMLLVNGFMQREMGKVFLMCSKMAQTFEKCKNLSFYLHTNYYSFQETSFAKGTNPQFCDKIWVKTHTLLTFNKNNPNVL